MPPRRKSAETTTRARKAPQGTKKTRVAKKSGEKKTTRARSAYIFFSKEKQSDFDKSTPVPERGRIIGEAWRNMTPSQKAPYEKMAAKDKERAEKERAAHA